MTAHIEYLFNELIDGVEVVDVLKHILMGVQFNVIGMCQHSEHRQTPEAQQGVHGHHLNLHYNGHRSHCLLRHGARPTELTGLS